MGLRTAIFPLLVALSLLACARPDRSGAPTPELEPSATIDSDLATFVFPVDTMTVYTWNDPPAGTCSGGADYLWSVGWWPGEGRIGTHPDELWLTVRCKPGPVRHGSLTELVADAELRVMTYVSGSEPPQSRPAIDSAVTAHVERGRVIIKVHGRAAVDRILATVPESVTLGQLARPLHRHDRTHVPVHRP